MTRDERDDSSPEAEESTETESIDRIDPLAVLTDSEVILARKSIAQGKSLFLVRLRFRLETIDVELSRFKRAAADYGEIITFLPTGSPADVDSIELDFLVAASTAKEMLEHVFARFEVMVDQVPATEEWLLEWDRQHSSTHEPTTVQELLQLDKPQSLGLLQEAYTYRIHIRSHVSKLDADLERLRLAIEPHAEIIDYDPTHANGKEIDIFDLYVIIESTASVDTLLAAVTHLGMTVEEVVRSLPDQGVSTPEDFDLNSSAFFEYSLKAPNIDGQVPAKPHLLGIFREEPEHVFWAQVTEGQTLYRMRVGLSLVLFHQSIDELKKALGAHGLPLAYLSTGVGDEVDSVEIDLWFASATSEDALRRTFAHFVAEFH